MNPIDSILFVCMGNICRSPAAEGVFRKKAEFAGLSELKIDSAGTIGFHSGAPADSRMRAAAKERGYKLDSVSRQVSPEDFKTYDLILAMDHDNLKDLKKYDGRAQVALFGEYALGRSVDVPDPYYGGADGFEKVLDLLEEGCEALIQNLR